MNKIAKLQLLAVLFTVSSAASDQLQSDYCKLPAENISLSILDKTKYYLQENKETNTRIYLGLCHALDVEDLSKFCDRNAFACVTKINPGKHLILKPIQTFDSFLTSRIGGGADQKRREQHWSRTDGHQQHCGSQVHRGAELC